MKLKSIEYTKKEIINFCIKNIQEIWNKIIENGDYNSIDFNLNTNNSSLHNNNDKINFKFMGKGTFGIVLRVAFKKTFLIIKIMKVKNDEPERCQKILKKINYLTNSPSEKSKKKLELIEKYMTQIYSISENNTIEMIFFEYLEGSNLKDYINEKYISQEELNLIFLKTLIGVKLFHKFLKLSHRDLKLENLFIEENNNVKIIDYGFVCDRDDIECYNKYQGTSKYIHPRMNIKLVRSRSKKKIKEFSTTITKNNNSERNNSFNTRKNKRTKNKSLNFPDSVSQDLFTLIIILLKLYYHNEKKQNSKRNKIYQIIDDFNRGFDSDKSSIKEKLSRYTNKKKLLKRLFTLEDDEYDNNAIFLVINILKNFWNFKSNQFEINGEKGDSVSSFLLDLIIKATISTMKSSNELEILADDYFNLESL